MKYSLASLAVAALVARNASAAAAQSGWQIPAGQMPPAGMCRVWIDGVPPGRQPAATDCRTAERNVPRNGRVIYGSRAQNGEIYRENRRDRDRDDRARRNDCATYDREGNCVRRYPNEANVYPNTSWPRHSDGRYSMPHTPTANEIQRWRGYTSDEAQWLGNVGAQPLLQDVDRYGRPARVLWRVNGIPVQTWYDTNRDGVVDEIQLYQNGRVVQTIR